MTTDETTTTTTTTDDAYAEKARRWLTTQGVPTLSLKQPWATLLITGEKHIETRAWMTKYRGPLLIHASKTLGRQEAALVYESPFRSALAKHGVTLASHLPVGKALGLVWLIACREMRVAPDAQEDAFGFFGPGRIGWACRHPEAFATPIPATGALGLWHSFDPVIIRRAVDYAIRIHALGVSHTSDDAPPERTERK